MVQARVRPTFCLLSDQPEDTQGGEGRCPYLRALQLPDLPVDEPHCEFHWLCVMPTNPYVILGWRHRSWECCLRQNFRTPSCHELPSSRTVSPVP